VPKLDERERDLAQGFLQRRLSFGDQVELGDIGGAGVDLEAADLVEVPEIVLADRNECGGEGTDGRIRIGGPSDLERVNGDSAEEVEVGHDLFSPLKLPATRGYKKDTKQDWRGFLFGITKHSEIQRGPNKCDFEADCSEKSQGCVRFATLDKKLENQGLPLRSWP
jgi:hypothetical protein